MNTLDDTGILIHEKGQAMIKSAPGKSPLATMSKDVPTQESKSFENRKTRYTKQVIREAFINLMQQQPIEKVTVTRICEIADISRGTFYLHYRDPYDLLESMEDEYLEKLERQFKEKIGTSKEDYSETTGFWLEILQELLTSRDLAQLFFTNPHSSFLTKCLALNRSFADELCKNLYPTMTVRERDYMHTFYEHGSASIISMWVRGDFPEPPEQIAELLMSVNQKNQGSTM